MDKPDVCAFANLLLLSLVCPSWNLEENELNQFELA